MVREIILPSGHSKSDGLSKKNKKRKGEVLVRRMYCFTLVVMRQDSILYYSCCDETIKYW